MDIKRVAMEICITQADRLLLFLHKASLYWTLPSDSVMFHSTSDPDRAAALRGISGFENGKSIRDHAVFTLSHATQQAGHLKGLQFLLTGEDCIWDAESIDTNASTRSGLHMLNRYVIMTVSDGFTPPRTDSIQSPPEKPSMYSKPFS